MLFEFQIKNGDPLLNLIIPPNHFNCRSVLNPIMITDSENPDSYYNNYKDRFQTWGTDIPAGATMPAEGFGG